MSRTRAVIAAAATVVALTLGSAVAAADTPFDVDLTGDADGTIQSFGYTNTATYGQTITVPDGVDGVASFSFVMDLPEALVFRGVLRAWESGRATGPELYVSEPRSTAGDGPEVVTFTADMDLEPGLYVIYATISYDYATNAEIEGPTQGAWRTTSSDEDAYPDGATVYLNNGGDLDALTTEAWTPWPGADLSFALTFFAAEDPEEPGGPEDPADPADPVVAEPTFTG